MPTTEVQPLDTCPCCGHEQHDGLTCGQPMPSGDGVCECAGPLAEIDFAPALKPTDVPWKYEAGRTRARMIARELGYDE